MPIEEGEVKVSCCDKATTMLFSVSNHILGYAFYGGIGALRAYVKYVDPVVDNLKKLKNS